MKDTYANQKRIANDIHLKNVFISNTYLELGIIDVDVMQRLLKYEIININEIAYFPVQNKGLGHSELEDSFLKNYLPYHFFRKLANNNSSYQLCITYGLVQYISFDHRESFMPIILIPINIYYENNELLVQMISSPIENPMLSSIFNNNTKLSFIQNLNLTDINALDYILYTLSKMNDIGVRLDNYLTCTKLREPDIILTYKNFITPTTNVTLGVDKLYRLDNDFFMSRILNKQQRLFLERSMNGESLSLTGFSGTGKTTVLKDIIINNMGKGLRTLYVSNSKESLQEMYNKLHSYKLDRFCVNLADSFRQIASKNFDDIYLEPIEDTVSLIKQVNEYYDVLEAYENNMNKTIYDFRFCDVINAYFVTDCEKKIINIEQAREQFDDLSSIYKHEYEDIVNVLKSLEINTQKIKSFRNSVWNAIPIVNNIKHVNQVLNVVFQLNKGLKKLRENEILLGNYGVKSILSFSEMKKCISPMERITNTIIPDEWKTSFDVYYQAKEKYSDLKKDIYLFQEAEYYLSTKYKNLSSINIDDEIKLLYGSFYNKSNIKTIEDILKNEKEIMRIMKCTENDLKSFYNTSNEISEIMNWKFMDKDAFVYEISTLGIILNENYLNGKMIIIVLNNKVDSSINELNSLHKSICTLTEDINKLEQQYKKLKTLNFSKGNIVYENEDFRTYDTKTKKIRRFAKEYIDICGVSYQLHERNIKSIEVLKKYYDIIKPKKYRKIIIDFLQGLDDSNYIKSLTLFNICEKSYRSIQDEMEFFSKYDVSFKCSSIKDSIQKLDNYLYYLHELYQSNKRLMGVVLNNELPYVVPNEYYGIRKNLNNFNNIIKELRENEEYKRLYGHLYLFEETNVMNINKIIQMYDAYIYVFINNEKVTESFNEFDDLRVIVDNIVALVADIGENLRLYSLLFKDSVSRYYFSNIETNVEYLSKLLNAKDELVLYLNITHGIGILNDYRLSKLINYIEQNDDITGITNAFSELYFHGLIEKYLANKDNLLATNDYIEALNKTIALENVICKLKGSQFINKIIAKNPLEFRKKKIKYYDYYEFFKQNHKRLLVYLCDKNFLNMYSKMIDFDVIIIDDAHMIITGEYNNLFKGKQIIISGDYQSNKIVNQNLISLASNLQVTTLKSRYEVSPKKLANSFNSIRLPYISKYDENIGIRVIEKGLENYLYNLYMDDSNVRINYFIKNINYQKEVYENIAKSFFKKNISSEEIINFLNNNIFIVDINNRNYIKSDYNVLFLKDYCYEDSQIIASNLFEILMLVKKELIIYDNESSLLKSNNYEFFRMIKRLVISNDIFVGQELETTTKIIANNLVEKGYKVFFPGNGINLTVQKMNSQELVAIVILFSNGQVYEMLNQYREIYEQYISNGHKVIFKVMPDLLVSSTEFMDRLIGDING